MENTKESTSRKILLYLLGAISGLSSIIGRLLLNQYTSLTQYGFYTTTIIGPFIEELLKFISLYILINYIFKLSFQMKNEIAYPILSQGLIYGFLEWIIAYSSTKWILRILAIGGHCIFGFFNIGSVFFHQQRKTKIAFINFLLAFGVHMLWNDISILLFCRTSIQSF